MKRKLPPIYLGQADHVRDTVVDAYRDGDESAQILEQVYNPKQARPARKLADDYGRDDFDAVVQAVRQARTADPDMQAGSPYALRAARKRLPQHLRQMPSEDLADFSHNFGESADIASTGDSEGLLRPRSRRRVPDEQSLQGAHKILGNQSSNSSSISVDELPASPSRSAQYAAPSVPPALATEAEKALGLDAPTILTPLAGLRGMKASQRNRLEQTGISSMELLADTPVHTIAATAKVPEERAQEWRGTAKTVVKAQAAKTRQQLVEIESQATGIPIQSMPGLAQRRIQRLAAENITTMETLVQADTAQIAQVLRANPTQVATWQQNAHQVIQNQNTSSQPVVSVPNNLASTAPEISPHSQTDSDASTLNKGSSAENSGNKNMDKLELQADSSFFELPELTNLSLADLQKLWDSIPTEDQAYLSRVFEREADKRQVVEDIDEARMSQYFLEQYLKLGFVPSGDVWLKVPLAIREQYKLPLAEKLDVEERTTSAHEKQAAKTQIPKWLLILAIPFVCLMIFTLMRLLMGNSDDANTSVILATETPSPTASPTATVSPTALPPSPTPFGLTGFDDAIRSGSPSNRDYYPVQLQVFTQANRLPRVFIVQEQEIGLADWRFDPNPDIVSWLNGMIVRPVLGVPFNQANLELFQSISEESVFVVTMNTGTVLQFTNPRSHLVGRAETNYFRQDSPGLVLVLIGETFADGSPTDIRYLVQASYPVEQELSYLAAIQPTIIPMGTSQALGDFVLTITDAQISISPNLPPELFYALVNIQVLSGKNAVALANWQWFLELATGERISLEPNIANVGACSSLNTNLSANTSSCFTLTFIVPRQLETGRLLVGNSGENLTVFDIQFSVPPVVASPLDLDVHLGRISYTRDSLLISARVYNPTIEAITISAQDFSLVLGFVPNPTGLAVSPVFSSQIIEPSATLDLNLEFPYTGEGYGMLMIIGRIWAMKMP